MDSIGWEYLIIINGLAFFAFALDKWRAVQGKWRIKESTLLLLALAGGSVGGLCGMYLCRHKTRKAKFSYGIPTILFLQLLIGYLIWNR